MKRTRKRGKRAGGAKRIALLFLTKGEIMHRKIWKEKGYEEASIYIHPKYPGQNGDWTQWEVSHPVPTKWGDGSIVVATLILLKKALENPLNQVFVLCAEDSYPLMFWREFQAYWQKDMMSYVQCMDASKGKSSQWWILVRKDAEKLVARARPDKCTKQTNGGACDEHFLLNVLPELVYRNRNGHFVKWITDLPVKGAEQLVAKHPTTFQRVIGEEGRGYFFIRKTTREFLEAPLAMRKRAIWLVHGTQSPPIQKRIPNGGDFWLFVLNLTDEVPVDLPENLVQIYSVVWNQVAKAIEVGRRYLKRLGFEEIICMEEKECKFSRRVRK